MCDKYVMSRTSRHISHGTWVSHVIWHMHHTTCITYDLTTCINMTRQRHGHTLANILIWKRKLCVWLLEKSPTKETYILQKRPIFLRRLLIIATPYALCHAWNESCRALVIWRLEYWVTCHTHTHTHTRSACSSELTEDNICVIYIYICIYLWIYIFIYMTCHAINRVEAIPCRECLRHSYIYTYVCKYFYI